MNAQLQPERQQWLNNRRAGIGGSDVAPILGLSPYRSPLDVYLDKRGELPDQADNEPMYWGRALEPAIRQAYADRTGRTVAVPTEILVHPRYSFMLANVDGLTDDGRVFEAKTARSGDGWGEEGTDQVPEAYALQVQHYLAVTGYKVADVAVLIGGSDFRLYEVPADPDLQGDMIEAEANFWQRVIDGIPPEPITFAEAQRAYGRSSSAGTIIASQDAVAAWLDLKRARDAIDAAEAEAEAAKAVLMRELADRGDTLLGPNGKPIVTWKLAKAAARFDTAAFKAAHPDLAAQFTREGEPSRRFLSKD